MLIADSLANLGSFDGLWFRIHSQIYIPEFAYILVNRLGHN